jgi:hypothetical protein
MKMSKAVANVSHMNRTSVVQKKETEELKNKVSFTCQFQVRGHQELGF